MLKVEYTNDTVFSFEGPNLCLLGKENDFKQLGKAIVDLTSQNNNDYFELSSFSFVQSEGEQVKVVFSSKKDACVFGKFKEGKVVFELDSRYWERIFIFFALMSWDKKTYYLNSFEDALRDLPLEQEIHFICSSEF